jgi:uncharacterized membrane protein
VKIKIFFNALLAKVFSAAPVLAYGNQYQETSPGLVMDGPPASHTMEPAPPADTRSRIESIDLLRGIVMVIMALDHVRGYFHFETFLFSPTDLQHTTPALFATRLITHLCAPTFIFLAGTSAYFIARRKTVKEASFFLVTRGVWLIVLQLTLIRFAWNFDPAFHYNSSNIISTIGFCMIALSLLIHLQLRTVLIIGLIMVLGHNALDGISFENGSAWDVAWSFLHVKKVYALSNDYSFLFLYPFIPWTGVMALGYCLGSLYDQRYALEKRKNIILQIGMLCLFFFLVLRVLNVYGDPVPWSYHQELSITIMSFLNLEKYPPSLLFLCLTLGISLTVLGILEGRNLKRWSPITVFGKAPLFYYVLHIVVIHALALVAVVWLGYPWQTMIFIGSPNQASPLLKGSYGFSLEQVYLLWIFVVALLYPLCEYWDRVKGRNKKKWWVSYV